MYAVVKDRDILCWQLPSAAVQHGEGQHGRHSGTSAAAACFHKTYSCAGAASCCMLHPVPLLHCTKQNHCCARMIPRALYACCLL